MSAVTSPVVSEETSVAQADPYPYGWREVPDIRPDGEVKWKRVPLTLEDILHPQVGDFRMHSEEHERICLYLYNVLVAVVAAIRDAIVLHDVRVAWDIPGLDPHGPDIAVIFGVREQRNWRTFDVAEEGIRPSLIVEVTSPSTRRLDLVDKVDEYERAGVPLYVIVDINEQQGVTRRRLLGYQLTPAGYVSLSLNDRGWLWLDPVRLWLGIRGDRVVCYDENGDLIEDYIHVTAARAEAEARASEAEAQAASEARARAEAEARVRQLEAELRRLRGEEDN